MPNKKTLVSGPQLFGLQLKCIHENRTFNQQRPLKLVSNCCKSTLAKRAITLGKRQQVQFQNIADKLYNLADKAVIKSLEFLVQDREFYVYFKEENLATKK